MVGKKRLHKDIENKVSAEVKDKDVVDAASMCQPSKKKLLIDFEKLIKEGEPEEEAKVFKKRN